jgi:hypothetical protein
MWLLWTPLVIILRIYVSLQVRPRFIRKEGQLRIDLTFDDRPKEGRSFSSCVAVLALHSDTPVSWARRFSDFLGACPGLAPVSSNFLVSTRRLCFCFLSVHQIMNYLSAGNSFITKFSLTLSSRSVLHIHSSTIKFPNWRCYSNTTNAIYRGWTGLARERLFMYVQVSTCLVEAYDDYSCFGEVSFFVVSKVSKWKEEQRLSFV